MCDSEVGCGCGCDCDCRLGLGRVVFPVSMPVLLSLTPLGLAVSVVMVGVVGGGGLVVVVATVVPVAVVVADTGWFEFET